jgi:cyclophilin family peptidyl-prolyl cis-trans isomerase
MRLVAITTASLLALAAAPALAQGLVNPSAPPPPPGSTPPPAAAPAPAAAAPAATAPAAVWQPLDPENTLLIDTSKGRIVLEMRPDLAPGHVTRMKVLTRKGYYDGSQFYRVIKDFMAQTGDKGSKTYTSDMPNLKAEFSFAAKPAAYRMIGTYAGGEIGFVGATPVAFDTPPGGQMKGWVLFCPGVAAFAHHKDPDSANSQIFFLRAPQHGLAKTFTAFGRIIQGQDVIMRIADGEPPAVPDRMTRVRVLADVPAAERPALTVLDAGSPAFDPLMQKAAAAAGTNFSACDIPISDIVR